MEDDLDRIRLTRRCGMDFVRRRDAFRRAYDMQCMQPADAQGQDVVDINACGLQLRAQYGFPDAQCPGDSPMAELDGVILAIPDPVAVPEATGTAAVEPVASLPETAAPAADEQAPH